MIRRHTSYYGILIFAASMAVASAMIWIQYLQHDRRFILFFCVIAYGTVFAFLTGRQIRRQAGRIEQAIADLPNFDPPPGRMAYDFEGAITAAQQKSAELTTKLIAAEEDRKDRRELEAVLDSMQDSVVAVDPHERIQWTNARMQRLVSTSARNSTVTHSILAEQPLLHIIRDPEILACIRLALADRTVQVRRSTSLIPGRIFEVDASPMPGGGAVAVLRDITRMEEVERTQRDFVANVSHELRTPLTSITGYVETLLDHEVLTPQAREFLATILKNATRMNRLTEDLLVMARVEGPAGELHPSPVPADTLVRDAVKAMGGVVGEYNATLEVADLTSTQVYADSDAVMQVLGNLIENAVKYGSPGGRVTIRARTVSEPYDAVEFSVEDHGPGIASEHLPRIFERFYRVDKARSRESGGTGLGLSIARHMVQVQGGAIWAQSELGQGSTFLFTLPRALYPL